MEMGNVLDQLTQGFLESLVKQLADQKDCDIKDFVITLQTDQNDLCRSSEGKEEN